MSGYVLTGEARRDLQQIRDYVIEEAGFRTARYVIALPVTAFGTLVHTPGLGHR